MLVKIVRGTLSLVKNNFRKISHFFFNGVEETNLVELALIFTPALSNARIYQKSLFSDNRKFLVFIFDF